MSSTLFCLLLLLNLVSGHLLTDDRTTRRPRKGGNPEKGRIQDRQQRSDNSQYKLKVLDFSADNDGEMYCHPDCPLGSKYEFTSATLIAGLLPESFTVCSAIMVEAWTGEFHSADMFTLFDDDEYQWGMIRLDAASSYTQYDAKLGRPS